MSNFETYQSPFTWRYGSPEMRTIWSEVHKRRLWRKIWIALAETEAEFGLVNQEQIAALRAQAENVDIDRSLEIEAEIHHDLMAEVKTFAEQAPQAGAIIHLGATSMDIEDNADALRICQSLDLVLEQLSTLLLLFLKKMETWSGQPVMGFTHLQPAEPTTLGYRLAQYAQDLFVDYHQLKYVQDELRGKGFKGAVGTSASYVELLGNEGLEKFENSLSQRLSLKFFPITTQTYPRKQEYYLLSALAGLAGSLYKFAFDLRLLQSPVIGELSEPFGSKQVGSSAMPFKRNPINAEKMNSLARSLAQMPRLAWDNAAHSLLERTLDDSANRRQLIPEAFLTADELLRVALKIVDGLQVDERAIERNLAAYGPFAATERVLMALTKAGADRQDMHERLRQHAMSAWQAVRQGEENPLSGLVARDPVFLEYLDTEQIRELMNAREHTGDAAQRTLSQVQAIRTYLRKTAKRGSNE